MFWDDISLHTPQHKCGMCLAFLVDWGIRENHRRKCHGHHILHLGPCWDKSYLKHSQTMVFSNIQHIFLPGPTLIIGFPTTKDTLWMILGFPHFRKHQKLPCRGPYPQLPGWPPRAQELSACCHGFPTWQWACAWQHLARGPRTQREPLCSVGNYGGEHSKWLKSIITSWSSHLVWETSKSCKAHVPRDFEERKTNTHSHIASQNFPSSYGFKKIQYSSLFINIHYS